MCETLLGPTNPSQAELSCIPIVHSTDQTCQVFISYWHSFGGECLLFVPFGSFGCLSHHSTLLTLSLFSQSWTKKKGLCRFHSRACSSGFQRFFISRTLRNSNGFMWVFLIIFLALITNDKGSSVNFDYNCYWKEEFFPPFFFVSFSLFSTILQYQRVLVFGMSSRLFEIVDSDIQLRNAK